MLPLRTVFVTAILASAVIAGPVQYHTCSNTCTENSKFLYSPGTTYSYTYDGSVITTVDGSTSRNSGLHIHATANIEVVDKCEMALQLRDVVLQESDPRDERRRVDIFGSEDFKRAMEARPLFFSFQDGRIEDICPDNDEPVYVTNIKRGIISSFQNNMDDLKRDVNKTEIDVAGSCKTAYKMTNDGWRSYTIEKSKDLLTCNDRHDFRSVLQATPFRVNSDIQSLPITKGDHICTYTMHQSGRILKSECKENHIFRPFAKGDNGAVTRATHTLQFAREISGTNARRGNTRRSTLLFEHDRKDKVSRDINTIYQILRDICGSPEVQPETPRHFSNLVYKLRELDTESLRLVHNRVSNNQVCSGNHNQARKYFNDAIPMVGTTASVTLISELVGRKHVKDDEAKMWISSLAFVQKPTVEMIVSLSTLISSPMSKSALLPVTALINTFCKSEDCANNPAVIRIATALEGRLNGMCSYRTNPERENIILTLKAIGNMGGVPNLSNILNKCSLSKHNDNEIRIAAIGAFRRMSCSADRSQMLTLFRDVSQDSEIRIAAYLTVMQCPSHAIINSVTEMLNSESVNQVGSFVWTHLTNLKETSDVHKLRIKQILQSEKLAKEFDLDKRKFSRNYEGSFFLESINTGAKADANIIFSSESYIPRSGNLNLTVDLFGKSVNLLEVGGRVEGMEKMLETFLGPKGYFPDNSINSRRNKRSANNINRLHEQFQKTASDPKAAMYFRVFGNELGYYDLMKMAKGTTNFNILEALLFLSKDHNLDYSKSYMFLDTTITIPTIVGLPLKLAINGTATVNLKLSGRFDARKLGSYPRSVNIEGTVKPSGAIVIESEMGIDASVVRTGLRMVSTMHSSTELDGHIKLQDSQIMDVKLNMPREKQEFFTFSNKFYMIHRGINREQDMTTPRVQRKYCTGKEVSDIFGVKLCGEIDVPRYSTEGPRGLLRGPTEIALSLTKTDTHSGYTFEGRFQTEKHRVNGKNIFNRKFRLAVNTPGSRTDRNIAIDLDLNRMDQKISLDLVSPWKRASAQAALVNLPNRKHLTGKFIIDGEEKGSLSAEYKTSKSGETVTYEPTLFINYGNGSPVKVNAKIQHEGNDRIEADFKVENILREPLSAAFEVKKDPSRTAKYSAAASFKSQFYSTKVNGFVDKKHDGLRTRMNVDYGFNRKPEHNIVLSCKFRNKESSGIRRIMYDTDVRVSQLPDYSFSSNGQIQLSKGNAEANMIINYGLSHSEEKMIKTGTVIRFGPHGEEYKVNANFNLRFPEMIEDIEMVLSHQHGPRAVATAATATYGKKQRYSIDYKIENHSSSLRRYTMDSNLVYPGREMRLWNEISEVRPNEYQHNMIAQWQRGKQVRSLLTFRQTTDMYLIDGDVRITGMQPASLSIALKPKLTDLEFTMKSKMQQDVYSARLSLKKDGEHVTFSSNLNIPQITPIALTGSTKINMKDASLRAALNYKRQMYSIAYNHRFEYENYSLRSRGSIDVSIPDRRITTDATINYVEDELTANIKTKWDADRDESKMLSIEVTGKKSAEGDTTIYTGYFRPQYMNKFFTTRGTLRTKNNFIAIDYQWECHRRSHLTLSYEGTLGYGYNSFDSTSKFAMKTNLLDGLKHGFRDLTARTVVNVKDQRIMFSNDIHVDNEKSFKTQLSLKYEGLNKIEAHAEVKTPFRGYKLIQGDIISTIGDHKVNAEATATIGIDTYRLRATCSLGRIIEGSLKIESPIKNFELVSLSLRHELTQNGYSGTTEVQWQSKKISIDVGGVWNGILNMNSHLTILTPFRGYEKIHFDLTNMFSGYNYDAELQLVAFYNRFSIKVGAKKETYSPKYDITIKVDTPFAQARTIHAMGELDLEGERPTTKLSIQWNPERKIFAEGALQVTGPKNFETTLRIITPFADFEENTFSIVNRIDSQSFHCEGDFATAGKRFQARVSGGLKDGFHGAIELRTPFDYAREIVTGLTFKTSEKSIDTEISFQWKPDQKFSTEIVFKVLNPEDFETTIAVMTPFNNFKETRVTLRYHFDGQSVSTEGHVAGWDKRFQIKASGSLVEDIHGNFELRTPFKPVEEIIFNFQHTGPVSNFKTNVGLQWAPESKITAQLLSACTSFSTCDITLSSKTPFQPATSMLFSTMLKKTYGHFESAIKINVAEFNFNIGGSGSINGRGLQASGSIKSSIEEIKGAFISIKGKQVNDDEISGDLKITWSGDKTISSNMNIRATKSDDQVLYSVTAETTTPFEHLRQAKSNFQITKTVNRIVVSAQTLYNSYHMRYNGELMYEPTHIALTSTLSSQHPMLREVKFNGNGQWSNGRLMINADASHNGEKKFNLNLNAHVMDALNVDTQLRASVLNYHATVNYKVQYTGQKLSIQSSIDSMGYAFSIETDFFSRHQNHIQGSIKVRTPFEDYERLFLSAKAEHSDNDCDASLTINNGRKKMLSINYNHDHAKRATLNIETGLRFLNSIQASFGHTYLDNGMQHNSRLAVRIFDDVLSIETDITREDRKMQISNKINIPMSGYEDMVTRLSLVNGEEKSFAASFEGRSIRRKSVSGQLRMKFPEHLTVSLASTCPYLEEASFELINRGSFPHMESELKGTYTMKRQQYQVDSTVSFASLRAFTVKGTFQGLTPEPMKSEFTYTITKNKFVTELKVLSETIAIALEKDDAQMYASISTSNEYLQQATLRYFWRGSFPYVSANIQCLYRGFGKERLFAHTTILMNGVTSLKIDATAKHIFQEPVTATFGYSIEHKNNWDFHADAKSGERRLFNGRAAMTDRKIVLEFNLMSATIESTDSGLHLTSSFPQMEKASVEYKQRGNFPYTSITLKGSCRRYGVDITGDATISIHGKESISADLTINNLTEEPLVSRFEYTHQPSRKSLTGHMRMGRASLLDLRAEYSPSRMELTFNVIDQKLVAKIERPNDNLIATIVVEDALFGIKVNGNMEYTSIFDFHGNAQMTSRIPGYSTMSLKFNHQWDGVKCNMNFEINSDSTKYSFTNFFTTERSIQMRTSMKGPYGLAFDFDLKHSGSSATNFVNEVMFEFTAFVVRLKVQSDIKVNGLNDITANVELTSPIKNYEFVIIDIKHKIENYRWIQSAELHLPPRITYRIANNLDLQTDGFINRADIATPTTKYDISITHNGFSRTWTNVFRVRRDGKDLASWNIAIRSLTDISARLECKQHYIEFTHQKSRDRMYLVTKASANVMSRQFNLESKFSFDDIDMDIKLVVPNVNAGLLIAHKYDNGFINIVKMHWNDHRVASDISLNTVRREFSIVLSSSCRYLQDASFKTTMTSGHLISELKMNTYGIYKLDAQYNFNDRVFLACKLQTPSEEATMKIDYRSKNLESSIKAGEYEFVCDVSAANIESLSGNLRFSNPYYPVAVKFTHKSDRYDMTSFTTEGSISWQTGKEINFKLSMGKSASTFELRTPFSAIRNVNWNIAYRNRRVIATARFNDWRGEADIHVPSTLQSNGSIKINEHILITHEHNYRYGQWNQKAEMRYADKTIAYDGSATLTSSTLNILVNIKSSCPHVRDFTFKYDMNNARDRTHTVDIKADEKRLYGSLNIDMLSKVQMNIKASKSNVDLASLEFSHEKTSGCKSSLTFRAKETYIVYESNLNGMNSAASFKSSCPYIKVASFKIMGDDSSRTLEMVFNDFAINGMASGRSLRNLRTELSIKQQGTDLMKIKHWHTSENKKVIANFEMSLKDKKPIIFQSECDHSRKPDVNMKVKLNTPFSILESAEFEMGSKIVERSRKCMVTIKYNRINFDSIVTYNGDFTESTTQLVTPSATRKLILSRNRNSMSMQLIKNGAKMVKADLKYELPQVRLSAEIMSHTIEVSVYNRLPKLTYFVKFNQLELDAAVQYYNINQFSGVIEVQNMGRLTFENINNGDIWTGKAKLKYKQMYVEFMHLCKSDEHSMDVKTSFSSISVIGLKYNPRRDGHFVTLIYNEYRVVINLDNLSIKKMNIVADVTHRNEKFASLNIQHRISSNNGIIDARLHLPSGNAIQGELKYVKEHVNKQIHLNINGPNHRFHASAEHENGRCSMALRYNGNSFEKTVSYGDRPFVGTFKLNAPIINIEDASITVSEKREGFELTATFNRKPFATLKVQGRRYPIAWCKIELNSQNNLFPNAFLEAAHKRTRNGYENKITLSAGDRQFSSHWTVEGTSHIEGQLQYRTNGNTVVAKLTGQRTTNTWDLRCEVFDSRNRKIEIKSEGTFCPFKTILLVSSPFQSIKNLKFEMNLEDPKFELSLNEGKQASLRSYRSRSKRDLRFRSTIPGLEDLHFSLSNEDKEITAIANINERKWEASLKRQTNGPFKIEAAIKTPMDILRHATVSMTHDGSIESFTNKVELYHHRFGPITSEVAAMFGKHTIVRSKVTTPFESIRTITADMEFDITGDRPLTIRGNVGVNSHYMSVTSTVDAKSLTNIKALTLIQTSFSGLRKIECKFTHRGDINNFRSTVDLLSGEKQIQAILSFENRLSSKLSLDIKTPLSVMKTIAVSMEKSTSNIRLSASVPTASMDLTLQRNPMFCSLNIRRQYQPDFSTTIRFQNERTMKVEATMNVNGKRFIATSKLDTTENILFVTELKSTVPSYEHIEVRFVNNRRGRRVLGEASLVYSYNKRIESSWEINASNPKRMMVTMSVKTPFEAMRSLHLSHSHKIRDDSASMKSEVKVSDKVMGVKAEINEFPKFNFIVEIQTPVSGMEKIGLQGNITRDSRETKIGLAAFSSTKRIGATIKVRGNELNNHGVSLVLVSPSFTFNGDYDLTMSKDRVNVRVQTQCNTKRSSMEATLVKSPSPSVKISLTSPYRWMRTAGVEFSLMGNANRMTMKTKYQRNGYPIEIEIFFLRDEMRSMNIHTKVSGHIFRSPIEFEVDGKRNPRNTVVSTQLKTPFEYLRNGRLAINHQGGLDNFATTATGHYNQHRLSFNTGHRRYQEGFVKVQSTHSALDGLQFSLTKSENGYTAKITYAPYKTITATVYGTLPTADERSTGDVTLQLTTPFRSVRDLKVNIRHQHSGLNFLQNKLTVTLNREKMVDTTLNIRCSENNYVLNFNMESPKPVRLQVALDLSETATNFAVSYNQREIVRLTVTQKDESTYYRKKSETSIQLTLPYRVMKTGTTIDSSRYQKIFTGEFIWDANRDRKVSYKVKVNDRSRSYQRHLIGDFELFTPIRTVRAEYSHKDNKKEYNTEVKVMWDAARDTERQVTIKTTYEDDGRNRNVQVSLRHPKMEKDLIIRVRTVRDTRMIFSGRTEVEYSNDPSEKFVLSGSLGSRSNNYTVNMQLSHPRSHLNVNMDSHVADTESKMSAGVNVNYLAFRRAQENFYLRTEIDRIRNSINLRLNSPIQNINMVGKMQERHNGYTFNVYNDLGNNRKVESNLDINTSERPTFDFSVMYDSEDPSKQFHISGKYLNNKEFSLESFRTEGSRRITDALFAVHLNTSRLLHTRLHWRPEMVEQYEKVMTETYNTLIEHGNQKMEQTKRAFEMEYEARRRILSTILPDIEPISEYLKTEIASFSNDYQTIKNELERMYHRNEFFLQDMGQMTNDLRERAIRFSYQFNRFVAATQRSFNLRMAAFNRRLDAFSQKVIDTIADIVLRFRPAWQRYAYGAIRTYLVTSTSLNHRSQEALEFIEDVKNKVTDYIDDNFNFITYRMQPYVQKLKNFRNEMRKRLRSQQEISVWDVIVDFTKEMTSELQENVQETITAMSHQMGKSINEFLDDLNSIVADKLRSYIADGNMKAMRALRVMERVWNRIKAEQRITNIIDVAMNEVINFATAEFDEFARSYKVLARSGFTVYNPSQGELQAEIHLPVELPKLHQLPNLHMSEFSNEVQRLYNKYMPEKPKSDYSFWDTYYKFKPTSDIRDWVPPFKGHAAVMNGKNFKTFDGREFEFSGDCSYVLSRDFRDAKYSIFIDYEHGQKASLTVDSNRKQVKIFNDGKVVIDDRQAELPYSYANTTVSRSFNSIILKNTEGLTVSCDLKHDICTVDVAGWFFDRTGGLLGTYDNEPNNDFVSPSREIKSDAESFGRSWQLLGGKCSPRSWTSQRQTTKSTEECNKMFRDPESIFRPCFKIVNPEFYNKICKTDSKPECDAMAFYVKECKYQGVSLKMPTTCDSCQNGESNRIQATKSADVVFLVEERTCNKAASTKIQSLLRQMDYSLETKGLRHNRFGLVAYGGEGVHSKAHIHTAENKLFSDMRQVTRALQSLDFENIGRQGDLTEAINFAAKYPFRTGVSKVMVVLPCGDDQVSASIESVLLDRAISMHIAIPHDFEMMTATPKTQYIFGVDKNTAYTVRDVRARELRGDKDFFRQIVLPGSQLTKTALNTQGSVFNVKKMTDGRSGYQKHFMDVFARRIAKTATPASCQICTCQNGETICRPCNAAQPTVPPMATPLPTPPRFSFNYEV